MRSPFCILQNVHSVKDECTDAENGQHTAAHKSLSKDFPDAGKQQKEIGGQCKTQNERREKEPLDVGDAEGESTRVLVVAQGVDKTVPRQQPSCVEAQCIDERKIHLLLFVGRRLRRGSSRLLFR